MRKILLLLGISCFIGCSEDNATIGDNNNFSVYYCSGSGWTGSRYELKIDSSGKMAIHDTPPFNLEPTRKNEYMLLKEEIDSIQQDLINLCGLKLRDYGFGLDKPTDYPTTAFKYSLNNMKDSTYIYLPEDNEIPNELNLILGRICRLGIKYDIH